MLRAACSRCRPAAGPCRRAWKRRGKQLADGFLEVWGVQARAAARRLRRAAVCQDCCNVCACAARVGLTHMGGTAANAQHASRVSLPSVLQ